MSAKRRYVDDEQEGTLKLTSDGDLLLKRLLEQQLSKETNLSDELKREREFVSTEYFPVSNFVSGVKSFIEIEYAYKYCEKLEQMKMAGLSKEDINFFEDSKKGVDHLKIKHKNLDPDYITERMENIKFHLDTHKLKTRNEDSVINKKGRHWTEFMLSIKPNSIETSLLEFAIKNEKKKRTYVPTTMDYYIKNIEKDLMNSQTEITPNINKIRKKARAMKKQIESIRLEVEEPMNYVHSQHDIFVENSKWDKKLPEHANFNHTVQSKLQGCDLKCSGSSRYTIKEGNIIKIDSKLDANSTKYKKLTLEQIKEIPKFAQYDPGIPSKILFIKNLPSVSKVDIENLFKYYKFESESMKIFKGKMRGCAFVELRTTILAEQALNNINGVILMNKPLIIEFGKKP